MLTATALLALTATQANVDDDRGPRTRGPIAAWFEPQAGSAGLLPLGVEVGVQISRLMITAGAARLPIANVARTLFAAGARFYLGDDKVAPYLCTEFGAMTEEVDDTGGLTNRHRFGLAGAGIEVLWGSGVSLTTDLQLGPEHVEGYVDPNWRLAVFWRGGIGYHF